jgi:cytochrome c-type biogenesis protein CcmH/NrfG
VHNPTDPEIPLALARLEGAQGNLQATQSALSQALKLKPNYTDAIMLVVQIDIANNDIPNAIAATKVAAQTAPGVAPIWFELGLLVLRFGRQC